MAAGQVLKCCSLLPMGNTWCAGSILTRRLRLHIRAPSPVAADLALCRIVLERSTMCLWRGIDMIACFGAACESLVADKFQGAWPTACNSRHVLGS